MYEYPAPQQNYGYMAEKPCLTNVSLPSYLCSKKGKILRIELGDGLSRSGVLKTVNDRYIILEEKPTTNQIVCNLKAVKSIDIFS